MKYLKVIWKAEKSIYLYWLVWALFIVLVSYHKKEFDSHLEFMGSIAFLGLVGGALYAYSSIVYSSNRDV